MFNKIVLLAFVLAFCACAYGSTFSRTHNELISASRNLDALERRLRAELSSAEAQLSQRTTAYNQANTARNSAHTAVNNALNVRNQAQAAYNTASSQRTAAHNAANSALTARNQADANLSTMNQRRNAAHQAYNSALQQRANADNALNAAQTRLNQANAALNAANTARAQADNTFNQAKAAYDSALTNRNKVASVVNQELALIAQLRAILGIPNHVPNDNKIRCGDRVRLQGVHGGFFLTATQAGCPSPHNDGNQGCANFAGNQAASVWVVTCHQPAEQQRAVVRREQKIGLRSVFGRWLAAENSGCVGHGNKPGCLNANRPWFRAWEEFNVVTTGNAAEVVSGAQIGLRSHHGNYVVHESNHQAHANRPWFQGWEHLRITKA